ncbi:hypothetical protein [Nocardia huaxiensis]|uniref:hypothetical protein n=1 Tax=Nocardia huaxiensis TaxID=2755382 RepID=UPI001E44C5F7|nr:hypothetical protein [Nocardia huaxiensis]UFS97957.1 hypothetical protein LPY97_08690 [Nocardia huaxiensis]
MAETRTTQRTPLSDTAAASAPDGDHPAPAPQDTSVTPPAAQGISMVLAAAHRVVPDRESALFYLGLGALTTTGLLSWPVTAVIGVGIWLAGRSRAIRHAKQTAA